MNNFKLFVFAALALVGVSACGQQAASSSQEAIQQAQAKQTVEEQVDYLISQANSFVNSQRFDEAVSIAQYVLSKLDQNSQEAKGIIETAKAELEKLAQQKLDEAKAGANKTIDDVKGKIGNFGQ